MQTLENLGNSVHFDFGMVPEGYGWVFPRGDHLSIGVLSTASTIRHLKPYFGLYMKMKRLDAHAQVTSLRTHLIPQGPEKMNIFADRGLMLVGHAAGFADPVTGERIFFAIRGVQIALKVILDGLTLSYGHIRKYNDLLKKEFVREMILAKRVAGFWDNTIWTLFPAREAIVNSIIRCLAPHQYGHLPSVGHDCVGHLDSGLFLKRV